jgi:transcriptional regulator with XRE-family HTH domain
MGNVDPALGRGQLRSRLRQAREALDLTQREVAAALDWSESKLIRIETGQIGISPTDLRALLAHYRVTGEDEVDRLVEIARSTRRDPWTKYRDVLNSEFVTYLGYEGSADRAYYFDHVVIPGVVQTRSYAQALIESTVPAQPDDPGARDARIRRFVDARMERQRILAEPDAPRMTLVIADTALRQWVGRPGSAAVQADQFRHLAHLVRTSGDRMEIRVLSSHYGSHLGIMGGYAVLEFAGEGDGPVLYRDLARPRLVVVDREDEGEDNVVAFHRNLFDQLYAAAAPATPEKFDDMAERVVLLPADEG